MLCKRKTTEKETVSVCLSCSGPLDVVYDYDALRLKLNTYLLRSAPPKTMKYLDFYPLARDRELITLDEGGTTLHKARNLAKKLGIKKLFIKNEGLNPTGAFKDRGSFVEINKAKELGFKSVVVASTGNMAASVSAYSAQAGLACYVFVPENTPRAKLAQSLSYGAKVIQIRGTYYDAANLAEKTSEKYGFYLAGDYVFRAEGQKSCGYELAEQMWREDIDWIIVPVGMGTNLSAIFKGLWEYYKMGLIDKLPRMVAVQAQNCNSIKKVSGEYKVTFIEKPNTICSAISCNKPLDGSKVIRALKETKGEIVTASDDETLIMQQLLSHSEALYVEPSAATTIVALQKLLRKGVIKALETVVCVATGIGLKDPAATLKVLSDPPTIEPDINEVTRVISGKLFSIRAQGVKEKEKIIFNRVPTDKEVKKIVKKEFTIDLSAVNLKLVAGDIKDFIKNKGKTIAKADLQSILENVIQQESHKNYLELIDFHIEDSKQKRPTARVEVKLNGKTYMSEGEGVGPVDAAINAIKKIIAKYDGIDFNIADFNVEIPTTGSDATVEVTMVLLEKRGNQVVEKGTSPDIIVASMNAFVAGYNELIYQFKNPTSSKSRGLGRKKL
ncbi:threonine synthase [Candidatus Gottesmanbacteria bacterium]|nr:threonine synthase [Candidatus Gottesmanbacteria bacterium]